MKDTNYQNSQRVKIKKYGFITENVLIINNLHKKRNQAWIVSLMNSPKHLIEKQYQFHDILPKIEAEDTLSNLFYQANIPLIPN